MSLLSHYPISKPVKKHVDCEILENDLPRYGACNVVEQSERKLITMALLCVRRLYVD